ncbi:MAG: hypothetical protein IPQ07_12950 [Myxococcales bacterium]|nr:hypothetical protein [Myxococcales bacterium]
MKTLLLVALVGLASACTAASRSAAVARPTVSSAQAPECKEIPTLTGKPMRCQAVPPSVLRQQ